MPEDDLVFFLLDLVPQWIPSPFHRCCAQELRPTAFRRDHDGHAPGLRLLRGSLLQPKGGGRLRAQSGLSSRCR